MNKVLLSARISHIDSTTTPTGTTVTRLSLATNDGKPDDTGKPTANFHRCVAFKGTAEFISKWFKVGDWISIDGKLMENTYTNNDGEKKFRTDIYVNEVFFCGNKTNPTQNFNDVPWDIPLEGEN